MGRLHFCPTSHAVLVFPSLCPPRLLFFSSLAQGQGEGGGGASRQRSHANTKAGPDCALASFRVVRTHRGTKLGWALVLPSTSKRILLPLEQLSVVNHSHVSLQQKETTAAMGKPRWSCASVQAQPSQSQGNGAIHNMQGVAEDEAPPRAGNVLPATIGVQPESGAYYCACLFICKLLGILAVAARHHRFPLSP